MTDETDYRELADHLIEELKDDIKKLLQDWGDLEVHTNSNEIAKAISELLSQIEAVEKGRSLVAPKKGTTKTSYIGV